MCLVALSWGGISHGVGVPSEVESTSVRAVEQEVSNSHLLAHKRPIFLFREKCNGIPTSHDALRAFGRGLSKLRERAALGDTGSVEIGAKEASKWRAL